MPPPIKGSHKQFMFHIYSPKPAPVAQTEPCLTGNQVTGLIPVRPILSLPLIQERQLSVSGERMCTSVG